MAIVTTEGSSKYGQLGLEPFPPDFLLSTSIQWTRTSSEVVEQIHIQKSFTEGKLSYKSQHKLYKMC